jgi:hypothetical protein
MTVSFIAAVALMAGPSADKDVGPLVRALWLIQRYGTAAAVDPANDQRLKGALVRAIGKDGSLTLSKLDGFMEPDVASKLGGADGRLGPEEVRKAVDAAVPESRGREPSADCYFTVTRHCVI